MPKLRFEGHSDDTFGEYDYFHDDYDCCASGRPIVFKLTCGDEGLFVYGQYNGKDWPDETPGCWMIGIQQLDEDQPLRWPMRFEVGECGYSPALIIEAPDGVEMTCLNLIKEA